MSQLSACSVVLRVAVLCACVAVVGCAGSSSSSPSNKIIDPGGDGLEGSWEYLVTNAFEATFTGCTGDATVLEGATFYQAQTMAPLCLAAVRFDVSQAGDAFEIMPHAVTCTDGASGTVTGEGQLAGANVGGQWESSSSLGVGAVQVFTGSVVGDMIAMSESHRTFTGSFQGACDLVPALTSTVRIE